MPSDETRNEDAAKPNPAAVTTPPTAPLASQPVAMVKPDAGVTVPNYVCMANELNPDLDVTVPAYMTLKAGKRVEFPQGQESLKAKGSKIE